MPHFNLTARFWLGTVAKALLCAAIVWTCFLLLRQYSSNRIAGVPAEPVAPIRISQSPLSAESRLHIAVAPPLDRRYPAQSAPIRLLLQNDGGAPGQFAPAEVPAGGCIHLDVSHLSSDRPVAAGPAITVPAHSTASVDIPVDNACAGEHLPHTEMAQLSYLWSFSAPVAGCACANPHRKGKSSRSFNGLISTSPITVTSPQAEFNGRAFRLTSSLARDFTWPVLLALLAFFTQSVLARRAERQQIFNTLLPSYTDLVQSHYLPITRRMKIIQLEADAIAAGLAPGELDVALQRTFCAILLMRSRTLHLLTAKGGVFFRSSIAEELWVECFSTFYHQFALMTGNRGLCEATAASLDPDFSLQEGSQFLFSFARAADVQRLLNGFIAQATDNAGNKSPAFLGLLVLLELAGSVMSFECDRIYYQGSRSGASSASTWYFDPPQLEFSGNLNAVPLETRNKVSRLLTRYLDGIPGQCRREVAYP